MLKQTCAGTDVACNRVVAIGSDFRSECRHGTKGILKVFLYTVLTTARVIKTNKNPQLLGQESNSNELLKC